MKKLFVKGSFVLLSIMLILSFTACDDGGGSSSKSGAAILTTDDIEATYTNAGAAASSFGKAGTVISQSAWAALTDKTGLSAGQIGELDFSLTTGLTSATFIVNASKKAVVTYAVVEGNTKPATTDFKSIKTASGALNTNDTLYIKVVSESGKTTNYYCATLKGLGSGPTPSTIIVNAKVGDTTVNNISTGSNAALASVQPQTVDLPRSAGTGTVVLSVTAYNELQEISWAKVATSTVTPADSDFADLTKPASGNVRTANLSGLANGQIIFIKVISGDKSATLYYGINISIGNIAELETLTIQNDAITTLGTPGNAWNTAVAGTFFWDSAVIPPAGFVIVAAAADGGAVKYAVVANSTTAPASYADIPSTGVQLVNGNTLYLQVTSFSTSVVVYYKLRVFTQAAIDVLYGQPEITKGVNGAAPTLDPMWDTTDWMFNVNRINGSENPSAAGQFRFKNTVDGNYDDLLYGHTAGKVKSFWDDFGLYVYAEMDFHDYYNTQADKDATPPVVTVKSTVLTPASVADSNAHLYDDLEIFTNERLQEYTTGNYGIQYRVAPSTDADASLPNEGTYTRTSGNNSTPGFDGVTTFRNSGNYYTWIRKNAQGKELGYSTIAYIPWMFKSETTANSVFGDDGKVKTNGENAGPQVGAEFQLNAISGPGTRDVVLTWNGVTGGAYQQVRNYGKITLVTGNLSQRQITRGAKDPATYTVTFDSKDADTEANPTSKTVTAKNIGSLPTPPKKAGFIFEGWSTTDGGTTANFFANTTLTDDITVYAIWTELTTVGTPIPLNATVTLTENTYGQGYQYTLQSQVLVGLALGDQFRVSGVFTVDRDVENGFEIGLINDSSTSPNAYWHPLTTSVFIPGPLAPDIDYILDVLFDITGDIPANGNNKLFIQTDKEFEGLANGTHTEGADHPLTLTIKPIPASIIPIPLAASIVLTENTYSDGYQYVRAITAEAATVSVGDQFRISGVFTVSREVGEDGIQMGIVNNSPTNGYWYPRSWDNAIDDGEPGGIFVYKGPLEPDTEYRLDLLFTIVTAPPGDGTNQLVFQTIHEFEGAANGSHTEGADFPLTLTFTPLP